MHQCVIVLLDENLNLRLTNKMYVFFAKIKEKRKSVLTCTLENY